MKIGVVIAEQSEIEAVIREFGKSPLTLTNRGFKIRTWTVNNKCVHVILCGVGEIGAAAATEMLIALCNVDLIVNVGVCGGLTADMPPLATVLVKSVIHYDFDTSAVTHRPKGVYPSYPDEYIRADTRLLGSNRYTKNGVVCASGDRFISASEEKRRLAEMYGAKICDMESAGILLTANRAGVPAIIAKVVSDGIEGGANEYGELAGQASEKCAEILRDIIGGVKVD